MHSQSEEDASHATGHQVKSDGQLWVDKYTAAKYMDLLTDDMTNRKVMTWLKSWDNMAFPSRQSVSLQPPTIGRKSANPFVVRQSYGGGAPTTIDQEFSKNNKKILMLFGPPGTGKSTLARVLARQVGYETREVNASDKRNGEELVNEIKNAITTNAHFNKTGFAKSKKQDESDAKKPICLILDEIDGALGGGSDQSRGMNFVADFLKKCIRENDQAKKLESRLDDMESHRKNKHGEDIMDEDGDFERNNQDQQEEPAWKSQALARQKRNKELFPPLSRPIILVCNDGFAKALFPLKDIVIKLKVPSASKDRLSDRMTEILRLEGIRDVSNSVKMAIIEQSNGDARSAITRIQMIAANRILAQTHAGDDPSMLKAQTELASLQAKDLTQSVFQVIEYVLGGRSEEEARRNQGSNRTNRDVSLKIQAFGDSNFLNDSLYQNYLTMFRYYDDDFEQAADFMDCLSMNQCQEDYIGKTQDYSMKTFAYMPSLSFKSRSERHHDFKAKFEYPKMHRDIFTEKRKNEEIFNSLLDLQTKNQSFKQVNKTTTSGANQERDSNPSERTADSHQLQANMRKVDLLRDVLPLVYQMIHPQVRAVNTQLMNKDEKYSLQSAIETMVLFDLKLLQNTNHQQQSATDYNQNNQGQEKNRAYWSPDVGQLVWLNKNENQRPHIQPKLQSIILQNYQMIKQSMVTQGGKVHFQSGNPLQSVQHPSTATNKTSALFNLLRPATASTQSKNGKKRTFGGTEQGGVGQFSYKFKEGHSKNFKRELPIDFFIN